MPYSKVLVSFLLAGLLMLGTGCVVKTTTTREPSPPPDVYADVPPPPPPEKRTEVEVKPAVPKFDD